MNQKVCKKTSKSAFTFWLQAFVSWLVFPIIVKNSNILYNYETILQKCINIGIFFSGSKPSKDLIKKMSILYIREFVSL